MIRVTRLGGGEFILNADLIESIEKTPDTVVTLTSGRKYVLTEPIDVLLARITEYRKKLGSLSFSE